MSILTSTSTGKNSVLDVYFFDKLGMIKYSGISFQERQKIPVLPEQNKNLQIMYTLGAVFIYMNDENEFFYQNGEATNYEPVKILSRTHLLEMVKNDLENKEQYLERNLSTISSYTLDCYKKIYNRLKNDLRD